MSDYDDLEIRIAKIYALAAILPPLITGGLEHYRWFVKRRDKQRRDRFYDRMNKAIDAAVDRARESDEG